MSRQITHFPEEPVNTRAQPSGMNTHLGPTWCDVRNNIARDQQAVRQRLDAIKENKKTMRFLKERIVANLYALDAIEGIK